ncbi:MAG: Ig-like domain-containing protein [Acetobacterium sp.]
MKIMKNLRTLLLVFILLFTSFFQVGNVLAQENQPDPAAASSVGVTYQTHVQNKGTMDWMSNGELSGTEGQGLRMEGMKIKLVNAPANASIDYYCHVENIGDQKPDRTNGELAGTEGQWLRLEALHIVLNNMPGYSVQYRVHVENDGWQDWVSDGVIAGTQGRGLRLEAVEIKIVSTGPSIQPTGVSLNQTTASIATGATQTLSATVLPVNATNKAVTWSSSNPAVATVNNTGIVTGVSSGTANIMATTVDGGMTASCAMTVTQLQTVTLTGFIQDQDCFISYAGNWGADTKPCLLMHSCAASGYGITALQSDGAYKFYYFDGDFAIYSPWTVGTGSQLTAWNFANATTKMNNITGTVVGTLDGSTKISPDGTSYPVITLSSLTETN